MEVLIQCIQVYVSILITRVSYIYLTLDGSTTLYMYIYRISEIFSTTRLFVAFQLGPVLATDCSPSLASSGSLSLARLCKTGH